MKNGMNKSVLACAVISAVCGVAHADGSSLTLYGRIDEAFNKPIGYTAKTSNTISGPYNSRIGFMGTEDLGDGLKAMFVLEHRFNPDTGTIVAKHDTFWYGRSVVGLDSPYGRILLGREYTPLYTLVGVPGSPWGADSLATNKVVSLGGNNAASNGQQTVDPQRMNKSINYSISGAGITFQAQLANRANNDGTNSDVSNAPKSDNKRRPYSLAIAYGQGPIYAALGYTNPSDSKDKWTVATVSYNFDVVKLGVTYGTGRLSSAVTAIGGDKENVWDIYATAPAGSGEFRFSYGQVKDKDADVFIRKPLAVGYYYNMSKRTHLYADYIRDSASYDSTRTTGVQYNKNAYELGIRHDF